MRILMLSWEYPPHIDGGLGRHVAELAPALAQQGIDVHVVTPVSKPTVAQPGGKPLHQPAIEELSKSSIQVSVENGVTVHRVFTAQKSTTLDIYSRVVEVNHVLEKYIRQIREQYGQCGLIHTHDWLTAYSALSLQNSWNCTLVTTIHATERGRARGNILNGLQHAIDRVESELIHRSNRVIVCSRHMSQELQTFFHVPEVKLNVVPNGVDYDALQNLADNNLSEFRAKFAAPYEQLVFTVARLVYEKGIHRLIDASPHILSRCPNVKFVIAGKGPETETLRRQANHLGVAHKIKFAGFVSDIDRDRLFQVADCAIFPSLYEPFGIVALEAMALGCPVVVSDVGGLAEVVTHRSTGITVYPDNPDSVAWGIIQSLTRPEWTTEQVENARKWVEENFTWKRVAELTKDVYQTVLDGRYYIA